MTRLRVLKKFKFFSNQKDSLKFAESLKDLSFGGWRFRVGGLQSYF